MKPRLSRSMRLVAACMLVAGMAGQACFGDDRAKYADVDGVLKNSCAACHDPARVAETIAFVKALDSAGFTQEAFPEAWFSKEIRERTVSDIITTADPLADGEIDPSTPLQKAWILHHFNKLASFMNDASPPDYTSEAKFEAFVKGGGLGSYGGCKIDHFFELDAVGPGGMPPRWTKALLGALDAPFKEATAQDRQALGTYLNWTMPGGIAACNWHGEGTGNCVWSNSWGQAALDDEGLALAADTSGNVVIGGYVNNTVDFGCGPLETGVNLDTSFIAKLSPLGTCLWAKTAGVSAAHIQALAIDAAGDVYGTGYFQESFDYGCGPVAATGNPDVLMVKLRGSDGTCLWAKGFGGTALQYGNGLAVDSAGDVLLTGYFVSKIDFGGGTVSGVAGMDAFLVKLDTNGKHVWSKGFGAPAAQIANKVATDSADNVLFTGQFQGTMSFGGGDLQSAGLNDIFLVKLDADGNHVWSWSFGDKADQQSLGLAVDASNNILLTGANGGTVDFGDGALTSLATYDAYLAKLGPDGQALWSRSIGGDDAQYGVGVAVDASDNIALTVKLAGSADLGGGVLTSAGLTDVAIARYDPTGAHVWSKRYGDAASQVPWGIALHASGDLFLLGVISGPLDFGCGPTHHFGGEDIFLARLSPVSAR